MPADPSAPTATLHWASEHTVVLALTGDHDLATRASVEACIDRSRKASMVVIDLSPCSFLDSTIIRSLLRARREGRRVSLVLPQPGGAVDRILHVTQLIQFFETTHKTLNDALATIELDRASRDESSPGLDSK